jgi:hypothetical protein
MTRASLPASITAEELAALIAERDAVLAERDALRGELRVTKVQFSASPRRDYSIRSYKTSEVGRFIKVRTTMAVRHPSSSPVSEEMEDAFEVTHRAGRACGSSGTPNSTANAVRVNAHLYTAVAFMLVVPVASWATTVMVMPQSPRCPSMTRQGVSVKAHRRCAGFHP